MDDGLIGLIIFIAILNIVGRIVKGFTRAAQQRKQATRQGTRFTELIEKLHEAAETGTDAPRVPIEAVDEEPFSWLREEEQREVLPPAPVEAAEDAEFLEHPEAEYVLDDTLVVEPVPVYTGEATFESVPGMPLETPFERPDLTAPIGVEARPRGLEALVDRRFTGLRRAVVYAEILRPCLASRRRPSIRRYA